jgi:hypothetical protein
LPGRSLANAGTQNIAHDYFINLIDAEVCTLDRLFNNDGA